MHRSSRRRIGQLLNSLKPHPDRVVMRHQLRRGKVSLYREGRSFLVVNEQGSGGYILGRLEPFREWLEGRAAFALYGAKKGEELSGYRKTRIHSYVCRGEGGHDEGFAVRLEPGDDLGPLSDERWAWANYNTLDEMLEQGGAFGVRVGETLVSYAAVCALDEPYAELEVLTHEDFRGRGHATACAAALVNDLRARSITPVWHADELNRPSVRVAEKLLFTLLGKRLALVKGAPVA